MIPKGFRPACLKSCSSERIGSGSVQHCIVVRGMVMPGAVKYSRAKQGMDYPALERERIACCLVKSGMIEWCDVLLGPVMRGAARQGVA